jgi:hypothetical protein
MARPKGSKNKPKINISGSTPPADAPGANQKSLFSFGQPSTNAIKKEGQYSVTQAPSFFYSPELTTESWLLPKSRQEILKWARIFFNLEPYVQCLVGDTRVPLLSGKTKSIKELYDEKAKDIWLYSMSPEGEVVPGKAERVELTRKNANIIRITLDNGKSFECTPDHKIMMRDGSYKEAEDLEENDSLMPLYRKLSPAMNGKILYKDYEMTYVPKINDYKYTHRIVSDFIYKDIKGGVTHHKDFNKRNNEPCNLQKMSWVDHRDLHKISITLWGDPVFREKALVRMKEYWNNSDNHIRHSKSMERVWSDPEYRKKMVDLFNDPIVKEKVSKGNFKNKETLLKAFTTLREQVWGTETHSKICSAAQTKRFKDNPELGKIHGSKIKKLWSSGKYKNNKFLQPGFQKEVNSRPDVLKANKNKQLSYWASLTPEERTTEQKRRWQVRRNKKLQINHKVVKVEMLNERQDTYDVIFCKPYFNFALECGVFVHNSIIMMHAYYPFSKFELTTPDKTITEFYSDMCFNENFDLFTFICNASLSYQKFGEAIMFGNMEKGKDGLYRWSKFILLEPELVEIKNDLFSTELSYELIPTEELKSLVKSTKAEDQERRKKLMQEAPEVMEAVEQNRNIKLDNVNVSSVARITDPSATRGTSPIQALFKVLIYQDWIRLAQSAYAQRYVFPIELWTIGDLEKNIIPSEDDLNKFRTLINQSIQNPPFSMVFPPIVKYEPLSTLGKNFPINNEYEYIHDQILVGLGVNKNLILGEGPNFSNLKGLALHKLMMIYKVVRDQFEQWMLYKVFKPIAEKNGFYTTVGGKKKLILPQISWYKSLDIEEQEQERQLFMDLHEKGFLSTDTLFSKFPSLDYATEQKKLEKEIGTIWDHGDDRLPKKISKPTSTEPPNLSNTKLNTPEPIEPIEPVEPTSENVEVPSETDAPTTPETPV